MRRMCSSCPIDPCADWRRVAGPTSTYSLLKLFTDERTTSVLRVAARSSRYLSYWRLLLGPRSILTNGKASFGVDGSAREHVVWWFGGRKSYFLVLQLFVISIALLMEGAMGETKLQLSPSTLYLFGFAPDAMDMGESSTLLSFVASSRPDADP